MSRRLIMRHDKPYLWWLAQRNRKARNGETSKVVWLSLPPTVAEAGTDVTGQWSGGTAPYTVQLIDNETADVIKEQTGDETSMTVNTGAGFYYWSVQDSAGMLLTAETELQ